MKRLKSKAGFTLMELLATMLILALLGSAILYSIGAGTRIYQESIFESHSALLADTLNNSLSDILRNSTNVRPNDGTLEDATTGNLLGSEQTFVFSNSNYAAQNAYIQPVGGYLMIKGLNGSEDMLVNTGAYPDLKVRDLTIKYEAEGTSGGNKYGGYFEITYTIFSTQNNKLTREVKTVVRLLNNP